MDMMIQICRTSLFLAVFCCLLLCTIHVNAKDTDEIEEGDVIHGNANLSQLIYDFGKTIDSIKIGRSNLDAASSQLQREVQDTVFQVKKKRISMFLRRKG